MIRIVGFSLSKSVEITTGLKPLEMTILIKQGAVVDSSSDCRKRHVSAKVEAWLYHLEKYFKKT